MSGILGMIGGLAAPAIGLALQGQNDRRQLNQQQALQNMQISGQKEMTDYNMSKQMEMWKNTGYGAQKEQMKEAGINPALMYGMGGGGGQSSNVQAGSVTGGQAPQGGGEIKDMMGMGLQAAAQMANIELMKSQAEKNKVDTENAAGANRENTEANTGLTKVNTSIAELNKQLQSETLEDKVNTIKVGLEKLNAEMQSEWLKSNISQATKEEQITKIKNEAIQSALKNTLTEEEINKIKEGIAMGWKDLDIKNYIATTAAENKDQDQITQIISLISNLTGGVLGKMINIKGKPKTIQNINL